MSPPMNAPTARSVGRIIKLTLFEVMLSICVVGPDRIELIQYSLRTLSHLRSAALNIVLVRCLPLVTLANSLAKFLTFSLPPNISTLFTKSVPRELSVTTLPALVALAADVCSDLTFATTSIVACIISTNRSSSTSLSVPSSFLVAISFDNLPTSSLIDCIANLPATIFSDKSLVIVSVIFNSLMMLFGFVPDASAMYLIAPL